MDSPEKHWSEAFLNNLIEKKKLSGLWDQKYNLSISIYMYSIMKKCKGITAPSEQKNKNEHICIICKAAMNPLNNTKDAFWFFFPLIFVYLTF